MASPPHDCLHCMYGDAVPSGHDGLAGDHSACMAHPAGDVKGKKSAGVPRPDREFKRTSCPTMNRGGTRTPSKPLEAGGQKSKAPGKCGLSQNQDWGVK